jgi:hypothetical protein
MRSTDSSSPSSWVMKSIGVELIFADVVVGVVFGQLVFKNLDAVNKAGDYPAQPCELLADVFAVHAHGARAAVKPFL